MYNEKGVRELLKYSELNERNKRRRHKRIVLWPASVITMFLMINGVNYGAIMTMYTSLMVIELVIFGLMDIKYNYSLGELFKDSFYLFIMNVAIIYLVTPNFLILLNYLTNAEYTFTNTINLVVSFIYFHLFWYSYIILTIKVKKTPLLKWKWELTGILASDKKRFAIK